MCLHNILTWRTPVNSWAVAGNSAVVTCQVRGSGALEGQGDYVNTEVSALIKKFGELFYIRIV